MYSQFYSNLLIEWYSANKRDLPWRDIKNPYLIWVSEIILQQTRVNQGIDYYYRFIERFPTVNHLAESDEDEVLKYWQGLGYYSRARNMYKAACIIVNEYGGHFPTDYSNIIKLTGIGEYTAAAISSFAFNLPYAVLDGNVYRVLSRLFAIETPIDSGKAKAEFTMLAQNLLPILSAGEYNQAIMEFGALQCVPVSPKCYECIFKTECKAFKLNLVDDLPIKSKKNKITNRFFNYIFVHFNDSIFLQKRIENDIWRNLYEFPLIESSKLLTISELFDNDKFKDMFQGIDNLTIVKKTNPIRHILSHQVILCQFIVLNINMKNQYFENLIEINFKDIDQYAISRLIEKFLAGK